MESVPRLPPRPKDSHKGMYGHGLIVGGSVGMFGAAILAGQSCLRVGAGLTTVACPESSQAVVASGTPCYMTWGWPVDSSGSSLTEAFFDSRWSKCTMGIGPGLGRSRATDHLCVELFQNWPNALVCDADGLNALSESDYWHNIPIREISGHSPQVPVADQPLDNFSIKRILTPHPGEWSRLTGVPATDREKQEYYAMLAARQHRMVVVLKGDCTFITDGQSHHRNRTGNPSLSVGGSGDCLTGILVGLLCQGLCSMNACRLGVHLHGLAADLAHEALGTPSTLGTDILHYLPEAFREMRRSDSSCVET